MASAFLEQAYSVLLGAVVVAAANLHQRDQQRGALAASVYAFSLLLIIAGVGLAFWIYDESADPTIAASRIEHVLVSIAGAGLLVALQVSGGLRRWVKRVIPGLDLGRPVHFMAFAICILLSVFTWMQYNAVGGMRGLADAIEREGRQLAIVTVTQMGWVFGAMLGVGYLTRRNWSDVVQRLGIHGPRHADLGWGAAVGLAGLALIVVFAFVRPLFVSPDTIAEEAAVSAAIASQYPTLPTAFVLSVLVAVGEEIFFRGALQPVFGVMLSSGLFVILHIQYTQSIAIVVLLLFTLMLAWLRQRFSTMAAIIAHFVYNFAQLSLWIALTA